MPLVHLLTVVYSPPCQFTLHSEPDSCRALTSVGFLSQVLATKAEMEKNKKKVANKKRVRDAEVTAALREARLLSSGDEGEEEEGEEEEEEDDEEAQVSEGGRADPPPERTQPVLPKSRTRELARARADRVAALKNKGPQDRPSGASATGKAGKAAKPAAGVGGKRPNKKSRP